MPFAPLAFLRQNPPARKQTSHNNPVTAPDHADGNGTESFTLKFHSPPIPKGHPTSTQTLPPTHNSKPSLYTPPPHYHLLQAEHFLVLSGTGLWHLSRNRTLRLSSGDTISIPALAYHWFENAPDSLEPLKFGYWYTAKYTAAEQRFFRNTIGYIADCKRAGVEVSVVQLCVFSLRNWIVIGVVDWGWAPDWVSLVVNTVFTVLGAGWGEFVPGYRANYEEYSGEHEKMT
jgi:mannose-6-phosphate isomerase-like protein (cupin superfamily)